MARKIHEFFGFPALESSPESRIIRENELCPFVEGKCMKKIQLGNERRICGVCSLKPTTSDPVVTCPQRMYAENYKILHEVADLAFGRPLDLISGSRVMESSHEEEVVAVFGKGFGKELRLPKRGGSGSYFVDWILARIDKSGDLAEFTALEVQTIDTTGNYRDEFKSLLDGSEFKGKSTANPNWENVNKRILPQIIYKGHVLRAERKCTKGLFFICPTPVFKRIRDRLGGDLQEIHPQPGSLTFLHYSIGEEVDPETEKLPLINEGSFTTTIDQVALAFSAPRNLPPAGSYEKAIQSALRP